MKSKKLIALAISAALAMSSVSMTAFAAYASADKIPGYVEVAEDGKTVQKIVINWTVYESDGTSSVGLFDSGSYTYKTGVDESGDVLQLNLDELKDGYTININDIGIWQGLYLGKDLVGYAKTPDGSTDWETFTDADVDENGNLTVYAVYVEGDYYTFRMSAEVMLDDAESGISYATENPAADDAQDALDYAANRLERAREYLEKAKEKISGTDPLVEVTKERLSEMEKLFAEAQAAVDNAANVTDSVVATDDDGNKYKKSEVEAKPGELDSSIDKEKLLAAVKGNNPYAFDVSVYSKKDDKKLNWKSKSVSMTVTLDNPYKDEYPGKTPKNIKVYHMVQDGDGWKVDGSAISGKFSNGKITFKASSFSPYVLTADFSDDSSSSDGSSSDGSSDSSAASSATSASSGGTKINSPETGDVSAVPMICLAVAALGATGAVAYKKRKSVTE